MSANRVKLPPLNSLRAFHAAARHGSIRGAADELLVTPQAVSQQIKLLEDTLQVVLFERRGRSIEPTEAAVLLSRYVEAGFDELAEGVRRVSTRKYQDRITLNVSPYFATRYLLQRLEDFRETAPKSDLRLTTMVETPDFKRDDVDVAIQWGYGDWGDLDSTRLVLDHKIICCTPKIAADLRQPRDLIGQTLLHPVVQNTLWADIFRHLGLDPHEDTTELAFHDAATMRRATHAGMGVGLVSEIDAINDLRVGDLVAPFGKDALKDLPDAQVPGFYLVLPKSHRRVAAIAKLCTWIIEQDWETHAHG